MKLLATAGLFVLTALAEIVGCYLPYLWLRHGKSPWLVLPATPALREPASKFTARFGGTI
jgi:small multidrug resistance family-3 protein